MATNEVHKNDTGTVFRMTISDGAVAVDISAALTRQLKFRKPDGSLLTKTATLTGTGADGKMQYTTGSADLDQIGAWRVQGYIATAAGEWHTDIHTFTVHDNLS